jgi:hypothetical protein
MTGGTFLLSGVLACCWVALWRDQQQQRAARQQEAETLARQAQRLHAEQANP